MISGPKQPWILGDLLPEMPMDAVLRALPVTGLTLDSRELEPGQTFVALEGGRDHGLNYLDDIRAQGAALVLYEPTGCWSESSAQARLDQLGIPGLAVPNLGRHLGDLAQRFWRAPTQDLQIIGVTGTNGKTSLTHFLGQSLEATGIIGTLGWGLHGALEPSSHTTPDPLRLQAWLSALRDRGCRRVAMEVSSHALAQGRIEGLNIDLAVFTNLTQDHLDYHGDMAAYAACKRTLFTRPGLRWSVLNSDDPEAARIAASQQARQLMFYGLKPVAALPKGAFHLTGRILEQSAQGFSLQVTGPKGSGTLHSPLLGAFNAQNLLAALAVMTALDTPWETALQTLAAVRPVCGRMETFGGGTEPRVVVDYAHTPDALEQVLSTLSALQPRRLICVFGCGGDRDRGKRPLMGGIAARLAHRIIITDDNPRHEDPETIIAGIRSGIETSAHSRVQVIRDRASAIQTAIGMANADDLVLIAGKGHEHVQIYQSDTIPFSDQKVVVEQLRMNLDKNQP